MHLSPLNLLFLKSLAGVEPQMRIVQDQILLQAPRRQREIHPQEHFVAVAHARKLYGIPLLGTTLAALESHGFKIRWDTKKIRPALR